MQSSLSDLLAGTAVVLADGATGTNYFQIGLTAGEPPEFWNTDHPQHVRSVHENFVTAGADLILTNSFGGTRQRLKLHNAQDRVVELAERAAGIARSVADNSERRVVVAGSVGPTGELFEPLGALTHDDAVATFREQIRGLANGGVDVIWIETMSAVDEVRAAATAAVEVGLPYVATCSFDTAGRTMMGLMPDALGAVFDTLAVAPTAMGANCGVGAPDMVATIVAMNAAAHPGVLVAKGNCGIPQFRGTEIVYSGTPEMMGRYAVLAADAGARIIGGCCGTTPVHLAAMRRALDARRPGAPPSLEQIIAELGPLTNTVATASNPESRVRRRSRG